MSLKKNVSTPPLLCKSNIIHMSNLNIYYQNVRGLRNKLVKLRSSLSLFLSYDNVILTETWLIPNISHSELGLFGYQIFRLDRNIENSSHSRGSGVLIAIKPKFNPLPVALNVKNVEELFVTITFNSTSILKGSIYLPS